ncbi:MAG TPA: hypothetical protein VJ691_17400 [Vicinamibacterales bacterium]|nr:hypothetical protein [Vicinamibacterales bacterium]
MAVTIPALVTVATAVFDERHVACDVTAWVDPSGNSATAVNCEDVPIGGGVPTTVTRATVAPGAVGEPGDRSDEQPAQNIVMARPTSARLNMV